MNQPDFELRFSIYALAAAALIAAVVWLTMPYEPPSDSYVTVRFDKADVWPCNDINQIPEKYRGRFDCEDE